MDFVDETGIEAFPFDIAGYGLGHATNYEIVFNINSDESRRQIYIYSDEYVNV